MLHMSEDKTEVSEQQRRRKRINLYKKIIIIAIIAIILLPTLLCIVLFFRLNSLQDDFLELKAQIESSERVASATPPRTTGQNTGLNKDDAPVIPEKTTDDNSNAEIDNKNTESETIMETNAQETETAPAENSIKQAVEQALNDGRKVVYLTFDDGPCENTENLLDVLNKYGVKATFFVNGHEGFENSLNRIVDEGHTLALHTYTHEYEHVYRDLDSFAEEIITLQDYLEEATGVRPGIFRFPGGSSNSTAKSISVYIDYLDENNLIYFDWNVSSGDGGDGLSAQQVYDNVMNGIALNDVSVVLMHDSEYKMSTFEAVPMIIESLQEMDALILPITADTEPVHHNVN